MNEVFSSKTFKTVVFQMVIVVAFLVLADIFLWLFFPVYPEGTRQTIHQTLPGVKETITYERNSFGFRSLSMTQREKPPDTLRIFCLGASTTDQATQSTGDTFYGILEKALNRSFKDRNVHVETIGYGRGGRKAIDVLAWAKTNLKIYDPDMVITFMGVNDLAWNGGPGYSLDTFEERLRQTEDKERKSGAAIVLEEYSQLYRRGLLVKRRIELWRHKKSGRVLGWHSENLPKIREEYKQYPYIANPVRNPDPIDEFSHAMDALLGFLQEMKVAVIVLGQPVLWKNSMSTEEMYSLWFSVDTPNGKVRASGSWLDREMQRYNRVQEQLAISHDATYIDLDTQIPKTLEYYFDDCHFTDLGSRKAASAIFPVVKERLETMADGGPSSQ
jgi:lysophospholipase L1-like esterase